MSTALAMHNIIESSQAAADPGMPVARPRAIEGLAFYRKHTLGLLHRYLRMSLGIGRTPCLLGQMVFRGRVSSYRIRTFEDSLIFVLDVEKCFRRLDSISQAVVSHVALESYTVLETAQLMGDSERNIHRIYSAAMDRLTHLFLRSHLLQPGVENLSSEA